MWVAHHCVRPRPKRSTNRGSSACTSLRRASHARRCLAVSAPKNLTPSVWPLPWTTMVRAAKFTSSTLRRRASEMRRRAVGQQSDQRAVPAAREVVSAGGQEPAHVLVFWHARQRPRGLHREAAHGVVAQHLAVNEPPEVRPQRAEVLVRGDRLHALQQVGEVAPDGERRRVICRALGATEDLGVDGDRRGGAAAGAPREQERFDVGIGFLGAL